MTFYFRRKRRKRKPTGSKRKLRKKVKENNRLLQICNLKKKIVGKTVRYGRGEYAGFGTFYGEYALKRVFFVKF